MWSGSKCMSLLIGFVIAQEFKTSLKEDTIDYSTYTANIKRKRPTPRKMKSGRVTGDDDDDDDDADWTGGVRRPSSGRKSNRGRQRL